MEIGWRPRKPTFNSDIQFFHLNHSFSTETAYQVGYSEKLESIWSFAVCTMKVLQLLVSTCRRITKVLWWWRATRLESFKKEGAAVKTWNSSGWGMNACQQYEEAMEILKVFPEQYWRTTLVSWASGFAKQREFFSNVHGLQLVPRIAWTQTKIKWWGYGLKSCDLSSPLRRTAGNSAHFCPAHLSKIAKHWILHAKAIISNHRSIKKTVFIGGSLPEKWILETEIMRLLSQFPTSHRAAFLCQNRMSGKILNLKRGVLGGEVIDAQAICKKPRGERRLGTIEDSVIKLVNP